MIDGLGEDLQRDRQSRIMIMLKAKKGIPNHYALRGAEGSINKGSKPLGKGQA